MYTSKCYTTVFWQKKNYGEKMIDFLDEEHMYIVKLIKVAEDIIKITEQGDGVHKQLAIFLMRKHIKELENEKQLTEQMKMFCQSLIEPEWCELTDEEKKPLMKNNGSNM